MRLQSTYRLILMIFFISSISIFINKTYGGECEQWASHPEWLWCDDFESGKALKDNYQDASTDGFSITSADAFEGTRSLCQHYTKGQVDAGWIIRVNSDGFPPHLFMRWYHKFENGFTGLPPKMARMRLRPRSGDWKSVFSIHSWIDKGFVVADVHAINSTQANGEGWLPVAVSKFSFQNPANIGKWVCFEMEVLLNTPGKSDGLYRIWADTTLITERTKVDLRGSENQLMNEVMLDCYWNGGSPVEQNRYFDNFIISTKRIGLVKLTSENKNIYLKNPLIKNTSTVHPKASLSFSKKPSAAYVSIQQDKNNQKLLLDGRSQKIRNVK